MPTIILEVYNYLVSIQFHPIVSAVVFLIIAVGKLRWEIPYIDEAKNLISEIAKTENGKCAKLMEDKKNYEHVAYKIENWVMAIAFIVSMIGEYAMYWPRTPREIVVCFFMSIAQIGAAWFTYFYIEKWGVIESFGFMLKKKINKE
jgi:hypothetical protein